MEKINLDPPLVLKYWGYDDPFETLETIFSISYDDSQGKYSIDYKIKWIGCEDGLNFSSQSDGYVISLYKDYLIRKRKKNPVDGISLPLT
ncbi:MAG: hypothetical protein MUC60_18370 [Oscillatoria sp. Prado101]|jgi:hypothetical protein|nr:hypothetical protein [Oscillatoria sp. Prado101]